MRVSSNSMSALANPYSWALGYLSITCSKRYLRTGIPSKVCRALYTSHQPEKKKCRQQVASYFAHRTLQGSALNYCSVVLTFWKFYSQKHAPKMSQVKSTFSKAFEHWHRINSLRSIQNTSERPTLYQIINSWHSVLDTKEIRSDLLSWFWWASPPRDPRGRGWAARPVSAAPNSCVAPNMDCECAQDPHRTALCIWEFGSGGSLFQLSNLKNEIQNLPHQGSVFFLSEAESAGGETAQKTLNWTKFRIGHIRTSRGHASVQINWVAECYAHRRRDEYEDLLGIARVTLHVVSFSARTCEKGSLLAPWHFRAHRKSSAWRILLCLGN